MSTVWGDIFMMSMRLPKKLGYAFFGFNAMFRPPWDTISCFGSSRHFAGIFCMTPSQIWSKNHDAIKKLSEKKSYELIWNRDIGQKKLWSCRHYELIYKLITWDLFIDRSAGVPGASSVRTLLKSSGPSSVRELVVIFWGIIVIESNSIWKFY